MTVESASFAITASHALNPGTTVVANPGSSGGGGLTTIGIAGTNYSVGGGSAPAGTVSGSAQITELGFNFDNFDISIEASVCPALSKTPPFLATNGNT